VSLAWLWFTSMVTITSLTLLYAIVVEGVEI